MVCADGSCNCVYDDSCEIGEFHCPVSQRKKDGNVKQRNREMSSSFDEGPPGQGEQTGVVDSDYHVLVLLRLTWDIPS